MQSSKSSSPLRATTALMNFMVGATEQNFDYEKALLVLKEAADADRRIVWEKDDLRKKITRYDLSSPQHKKPRTLFSSHDYLQQAINIFRGADEIVAAVLRDPTQRELRNYLKKRALTVLTNGFPRDNERGCQRLLKELNTEVCKILQKHALPSLPLRKVSKLLRKAESYAPLGDKHHYSVETITRVGKHLISQTDTPLTKITENQKWLLQNYQIQTWYHALDPIEQTLLGRHIGAITDGNHIASTYLREIPCLRNCYQKILAELNVDASGNVTSRTTLASYLHSASLATTQNYEPLRLQLAHENYQQLCHANPGKNVNVLSLCSRVPLQGLIEMVFQWLGLSNLDTYVVDTTTGAVGAKNTHIIPTNAFRFISKNTISYTCDKLIAGYVESSGIGANPECRDLLQYLTQNTSIWNTRAYRQACNSITSLTTREERVLAKEMVELRRLELKQGGFLGRLTSLFEVLTSVFRHAPRNRNARLAAKITVLWEKVCDNEVLCVSCKSGKDRTGYTAIAADAIACAAHIPELQLATIQATLALGGHVQFLAAHSGGKTGCFGLKEVQADVAEGIGRGSCSALFTSAARSSSSISLLDTRITDNLPGSQLRPPLRHTRTKSPTSSSDSLATLSSRISTPPQSEPPVTELTGSTVQHGTESHQQASQLVHR